MAISKYRLVFTGKLLKGHKHPEVQQALAQLLKIPLDQAGHLIQGYRFRINRTLDKAKAERLLEKIRARGADCSIEPVGFEPDNAGDVVDTTKAEQADAVTEPSTAPDEALSLDLPELTAEDDQTRPLATVQPEAAEQEDEEIVLDTSMPDPIPMADRAAYKPDDDSENVGTFYERSTVAESAEQASQDRRKRLILVAVLLAVVAAAAVWYLLPMLPDSAPPPVVASAPAAPVNPQRVETNRRLEQLKHNVKVWMIQYGSGFNPAQVTLDRLQKDLGIDEKSMQDGWGTALRFEPDAGRYRVISAGPDKQFGTSDDLKREEAVIK
ncbi:hypothetical protein [Sedimenticola sp.]|uniref:hypothetical protein n=1 Tax=Sedimenticola sp. TaxID=1940285 RepID=UPI003D09A531